MSFSITRRSCRQSWIHEALLFILLAHTVFGSPVIPTAPSSYSSLSSVSHVHKLTDNKLQISIEEEVFGPMLEGRSDRKKRLLFEKVKKAKQAKLLTLGAASGNAVKKAGKSVLKTVATLGIKAILFSFLYKKINQVLDFKTRLLSNLEHKNGEQNSQAGINGTESSETSGSSTNENPAEEIPKFNADKVSLQVPDAVFGPAFNIANGASQVLGTMIQNTALRIAKLFDALKPLLASSSSFKSKKRETDLGSDEFIDKLKPELKNLKNDAEDSPVKNSYAALTLNT